MITFKQFLAEQAITRDDGFIHFDWKTDLADEEDEGYLPKGYDYGKVLELMEIVVNTPGEGVGSKLMKHFLETPEAKEAELIFLDPVPGMGANFGGASGKSEDEQVAALKKFYARFGFRSRPGSARMWLVQKGSIPDGKLPS